MSLLFKKVVVINKDLNLRKEIKKIKYILFFNILRILPF